jgi:Domain of unknown function (DUF5134)
VPVGLTALLWVASLSAAGVVGVHAAVTATDRAAGALHVLMGLGMAGMFSPWGDPVPPAAGAALFAVAAAWFLARLLRAGGSGEVLHLVVGSAAMVLMYLTAPLSGATPGGGHVGHAGHSGAVAGGSGGWLLPVVALGLAGYFAWYAWDVLRRPEDMRPEGTGITVGGAVVVARPVGIEPVAHAVLSAVMATMFVLGV